jgi:hypothetical protein
MEPPKNIVLSLVVHVNNQENVIPWWFLRASKEMHAFYDIFSKPPRKVQISLAV